MEAPAFVIRSENDAYELLQQLLENDVDVDAYDLRFDGWPRLTVHLKGEGFQSTITPPLMSAFLELQRNIYKSYAIARYNTPKVTALNALEKEALQIVVKVEPGSSLFSVDLDGLLEKWGKDLIDKMDAKTLLKMVIAVAAIWAGKSAYSDYLAQRVEIRQIEAKKEEQQLLIEQQKLRMEERERDDAQETKRMEMLTELLQQQPKLHTIKAYADDSRTELFKRSATADEVEIQGMKMDGETAAELVKNARNKSEEVRLDGMYRILNVDSSNPDEFKVKVRSQESGDEFIAKVQDGTLDRRHLDALQRGEWSRRPVRLQINAKSIKDEIRSAVVMQANFPEQE